MGGPVLMMLTILFWCLVGLLGFLIAIATLFVSIAIIGTALHLCVVVAVIIAHIILPRKLIDSLQIPDLKALGSTHPLDQELESLAASDFEDEEDLLEEPSYPPHSLSGLDRGIV